MCTASNGVGNSMSRTLGLSVEFDPEISVPSPRVAQAEGYEAQLECTIKAFPPPAIFWTKEGDAVTNSERYQISHFASQDEITVSKLRVSIMRAWTHLFQNDIGIIYPEVEHSTSEYISVHVLHVGFDFSFWHMSTSIYKYGTLNL